MLAERKRETQTAGYPTRPAQTVIKVYQPPRSRCLPPIPGTRILLGWTPPESRLESVVMNFVPFDLNEALHGAPLVLQRRRGSLRDNVYVTVGDISPLVSSIEYKSRYGERKL